MAQGRHRLLERQIRKAELAGGGRIDQDVLLDMVSASYGALETSLRLSRSAGQQVEASARVDRPPMTPAAEEAFKTLLDNCPDAVIALDQAGPVLVFNRAAERLFGRPAEEVLGHPARVLFNHWGERHDRILKRLLEGPVPESLPLIARRWDGSDFPAAVSFCTVRIDGAAKLLSFWRDMSEHEAARLALVQAREEAEAANRAKSEFLAMMSHEIRTPLNGVIGMAGALAKTELTEAQARMIAVINDSGAALTTLLSDILDLSKIEAGLLQLESNPFDLTASVQTVAQLYEQAARDKGLDWAARISPELKGLYLGDPTRVRQILQNLLANAVKFTPAGGIRLTAEPLGEDGGVRLAVVDTGVGINPSAQQTLFSRFVQADASTTRKAGGAGLGLTISRDLAQAMGGEIFVQSRPGRGSRFWVDLPLLRAQAAAGAPEPQEEPAMSAGVRVLAVDDNPNNCLVLQAILSQAGAELTFAANGLEAMNAAAKRAFDLILMDVQMPVMDGLQATRAIRASPGPNRHAPIIALTADAMPEQVQACAEAGMNAHVAKPIRPDVLLTAMEVALRPANNAPPPPVRKAG